MPSKLPFHLIRFFCLTLSLLTLGACSTTTEVDSGWVNSQQPPQGYRHLFVLSLTTRHDIGKTVEQSLSSKLGERGIKVTTARSVLSSDDLSGEALRERVTAAVMESGADGVLVAAYLKTDVREEYVPPKIDQILIPDTPLFMGYSTYIGYHYDTVFTPGYYQAHKEYFIQSSLYDVQAGKMVWQAQSRTLNPPNVDTGINSFSRSLVRELRRAGALAD